MSTGHLRLEPMSRLLAVALLVIALPAGAVIPEPDHIFYGTPTANGEPVVEGVVSVALVGETEPLASYEIGSDPAIGDRFVLRVPIDSVGERSPGAARTGDAVAFFLDGVPSGEGVVGERGTVTLVDVDPAGGGLPTLSIADVSTYEGNAGLTAFNFVVSLSEAVADDVTFTWGTAPGTAQGGVDFIEVPAGTAAQINAGDLSTVLTVQVKGDTFEEDADTFFVNIADVVNALAFDPQAVGTILDDDRPPAISIADAAIAEGDAGTSTLTFTLSLTRPIATPITVGWATAAGTATEGEDYQAGSGVAMFNANELQATFDVTIHGDLDDEDDETFTVTLAGPSAPAVLADGQAVGTILDDDGFLTFIEAESLSALEGLYGATAVAVTPDGAHVYVIGQFDDAIGAYERDPVDGSLTFVQNLRNGDVVPGGTIDGLDGAESVAVSSDGAHVYVASFTDSALVVFARDAGTGVLDFVASYFDGIDGVDGLLGATSVTLSPDGDHVYVAAAGDDAVTAFERDTNPVSATYGQLTFLATIKDNVAGVDGLDGAQWVRLSPDGNHVYVASGVDKAVAAFARNDATGLLTFVEREKDGVGGANGLDGASSVAISVDGESVYVSAPNENAVSLFQRNDVTGALTYVDMWVDGVGGVSGLAGANGVATSFDARYVYVAGFFADSVAVFSRDTTTGALSPLEVQHDGFGTVTNMQRPVEIAVSGDDQHLYVAAQNGDAVVVFMRDAIAPSLPLSLQSISHTPGVFSNDPGIDMQWSGAADNPGGAGLDGYSFLFDESAITEPDGVVDLPHTTDPHGTTSPLLPDGTSYWFHFTVCDLVGNCAAPAHLGPYKIDQTPPVNPPGVAIVSTSHTVGVPAADATIDMTWAPATDALSGVDGYSFFFDESSTGVCDQVKEIEETDPRVATSPSLADGTWYFHLCTRDNAGNWSGLATAGPYIVEVMAPRVTAVGTVADTGDGQLVPGEVTSAPITQVLVSFSEPVQNPAGDSDPGDASNPANYRIVGAGPNLVVETTDCGALAGDDTSVAVASASHDDATHQTTVRLSSTRAIPEGDYRLLVCGSTTPGANSILDTLGTPLDGDGDGTGGDPLLLDFSVEATNLLQNPNFDAGVGLWTLVPANPGVVRHDAEDADGAPSSGSVLAEYLSGEFFFGVSQCVLVDADEDYVVGGRVRIDSLAGDEPVAYAQVRFYEEPNCSVTPLGSLQFSAQVAGDTLGAWVDFVSLPLAAPPTASSAKVSFLLDDATATDFDGYFDRLFFETPTAVFASGFETGDFTGWNVVVGGI